VRKKNLFFESKILYNNKIPLGRRGIPVITEELVGAETPEELVLARNLRVRDFYINGTVHNRENFRHIIGLNVNAENFGMITRGLEILRVSHFGEERVQPEARLLNKMCSLKTKGSKKFREVFEDNGGKHIPHNIVKFGETTEAIINIDKSIRLNTLWGVNFLDNYVRTFCFKLHNNTLGLNNRVSHFVRGHTKNCTFCNIMEVPEEADENPLHFFLTCPFVEPVVSGILSTYMGRRPENENVSRSEYFGGFNFDNETKNSTLDIISLWVKHYIWICRMSYKIPTRESGILFLDSKIKSTYENSKTFRDMITGSTLNIRF